MSNPAAWKLAVSVATSPANAAWDANGSAFQITSSSVQPSARSGFTTPESTHGVGGPKATCASAAQPFGQASVATGIVSAPVAVPLPPPLTVGALCSALAALVATLTVSVTGG